MEKKVETLETAVATLLAKLAENAQNEGYGDDQMAELFEEYFQGTGFLDSYTVDTGEDAKGFVEITLSEKAAKKRGRSDGECERSQTKKKNKK